LVRHSVVKSGGGRGRRKEKRKRKRKGEVEKEKFRDGEQRLRVLDVSTGT
jgi:hypothetical protein